MNILRNVFESIVDHSRESKPSECCGILLSRGDDPNTVDDVLRAENTEKFRPQEVYVLGHKAHMKAVDLEISEGSRIAGYYHSHPHGGTKLSARDTMQAVEGVTYLIIGGDTEEAAYAAWRLEGKRFIEESVGIIEG